MNSKNNSRRSGSAGRDEPQSESGRNNKAGRNKDKDENKFMPSGRRNQDKDKNAVEDTANGKESGTGNKEHGSSGHDRQSGYGGAINSGRGRQTDDSE